MAKTIFCISGLGADEKIFSKLDMRDYHLKFISWLKPSKNESFEKYCGRMAEKIDEAHPVILGVSFGGMVAIEIAKQMQVNKLVLVSAIKTTGEMPGWMKWAGSLRLNRFLPVRPYQFTDTVRDEWLGVSCDEERNFVNAYRRNADLEYLHWSIDKILNWKNNWYPENTVHIHGKLDKIFPVKKIRATHVIENGSHIMILNKAKEVGACINAALR